MSSGWKAIYDRACAIMADMDTANMAIKDNEIRDVVTNFDNAGVEALLMDIIHEHKSPALKKILGRISDEESK